MLNKKDISAKIESGDAFMELYMPKDDILYITIKGDLNEEITKKASAVVYEILDMYTGTIDVFVDINKLGKESAASKKIWKEVGDVNRFRKVALIGLHKVAQILASFLVGRFTNIPMKFFSNKDEALKWLRS